ncbi:MAG: hypothetical protein IJW01_00635 [Paludibacteraceae bacterium]|nr:hypothetical protein [Paludibacteraceae bacterium]
MAAIKDNNVTLQNILDQPIAFLYVFANFDIPDVGNFLDTIGNKRSIIYGKMRNQQQLIKNRLIAERGNADYYQEFLAELEAKIEDDFGLTPHVILVKLAMGETIAGKNWEKGVYGVGNLTNITNLSQQTTIPSKTYSLYNYNVATGKFTNKNGNSVLANPILGTKPDGSYGITGWTSVLGNNYTVTSNISPTGSYNITSVGSDSSQQNANGTLFKNANSSNLWASLGTYLPYIGMILAIIGSLVSLFKGNSSWSWGNAGLLNSYNTYPCQKDWADFNDDNEGMTTSDLLLLAAAAGAVYLIASSGDDNSEE